MPILLIGFAVRVFAADAANRGLELRQRLDSIEVETQVRKRLGKPIEDLEAASAELRDTLVGLRASAAKDAPQKEAEQGLSPLGKIPYIEEIFSFRPNGAFDWVIVGTGAVALLSGLVLVTGLFAGRKKKRVTAPKKQQAGRKINLAPTSTAQRAIPDVNNGGNEPPPRDSVAEFQSLVENLRKVAPPQQQPPKAQPELPRRAAPPDEPEPRRAAPPEPPPPLIVNAPESPHQPPDELIEKPSASEALSARVHAAPPSPAVGAFSDLVIVAAKDGLNESEISRRYQLSVDQVRLILRMELNKK